MDVGALLLLLLLLLCVYRSGTEAQRHHVRVVDGHPPLFLLKSSTFDVGPQLRAATAPENDGDNNVEDSPSDQARHCARRIGEPAPPPSPLILPEDASPLHPDLDEPAPPPAEPRHVDMPHHMATHTPEIRPPPRRHIINRCNKRNTKIKARGPVPCASTHTCVHRDATLPTALDTAELHAAWQLQRHTRARRSTTLHKLISVGFQLICWEGMCVIPPSPPPRRNYVASVEAAYAAMARYNYYWVHNEQPLRISQTSSPAQLKGTRWEIGLGFFSTVELLEDVESIKLDQFYREHLAKVVFPATSRNPIGLSLDFHHFLLSLMPSGQLPLDLELKTAQRQASLRQYAKKYTSMAQDFMTYRYSLARRNADALRSAQLLMQWFLPSFFRKDHWMKRVERANNTLQKISSEVALPSGSELFQASFISSCSNREIIWTADRQRCDEAVKRPAQAAALCHAHQHRRRHAWCCLQRSRQVDAGHIHTGGGRRSCGEGASRPATRARNTVPGRARGSIGVGECGLVVARPVKAKMLAKSAAALTAASRANQLPPTTQ
ncbi:hypothetical protein C8F04DRAFT_1185134 [Mycena alexandri]|uniref:Uncharacterized protein n=1 Tax=Mycena alexandri TaxID=1745969 RepID=A0AAD6X1G6_9AGAR|nr:hypothetical protein C8F04DRAFT_1185134 [Mycena alexandri]